MTKVSIVRTVKGRVIITPFYDLRLLSVPLDKSPFFPHISCNRRTDRFAIKVAMSAYVRGAFKRRRQRVAATMIIVARCVHVRAPKLTH